jgi:hypothetical protein
VHDLLVSGGSYVELSSFGPGRARGRVSTFGRTRADSRPTSMYRTVLQSSVTLLACAPSAGDANRTCIDGRLLLIFEDNTP